MRLIDELRSVGARLEKPWCVSLSREQVWIDDAARLSEMWRDPQLPVLLIDNVSEYYFSCEQEYWDLEKDFPNLAPPFPMFWAEHRLPRIIHSAEKGDSAMPIARGRCGVLVTALDPKDCGSDRPFPPEVRWVLWCEVFIDYGDREVTAQGPHGHVFFMIDAEGRLVGRPWLQSYLVGGGSERDQEVLRSLITWLHPVFLAVSFLHCKNVSLVENVVPKPLAKRCVERHGVRPCSYKTLVIEPLKEILRTEGRAGQVGLAKAMHICRGHFRDYRDGRGLFGKYKMLVWQPSIVRGTKGRAAAPRDIEVRV